MLRGCDTDSCHELAGRRTILWSILPAVRLRSSVAHWRGFSLSGGVAVYVCDDGAQLVLMAVRWEQTYSSPTIRCTVARQAVAGVLYTAFFV